MLGETWKHQYKRLQRQYGLLEMAADSNGTYNELLHKEERARDIRQTGSRAALGSFCVGGASWEPSRCTAGSRR